MKIGRNELCPCGSGKKYKKCHLRKMVPTVTKIENTPELEELRKKTEAENNIRRMRYLEPLGIYVNFIRPVIHQGRKFWVLGNRLYYERPPNETFHEFIIFILYQALGESWRKEQLMLPENEWHFIYRCIQEFYKWRNDNAKDENRKNGLWSAVPNGWVKSLFSLAFDISSLVHREHLPEFLLNRLKNREQYQGARYEIAIASIFARLGYKITFLDEQEIKIKHPEFIAEDSNNHQQIAVEVKSKIKKGVLHALGNEEGKQLYRGDVQRLYRHALKQNPGGMPFMIFLDVNVPPTPEIPWQEKVWIKDTETMAKHMVPHGAGNPDPCTMLVFTNFSYHYQTDKEVLPPESLITWAEYPMFPITNPFFIEKLRKAVSNYGNVPNLDIDVSQ